MRFIVPILLLIYSCNQPVKDEKNLVSKPKLIFVDSVHIRTAAGQTICIELMENLYECKWVIGNDTFDAPELGPFDLRKYKKDRSTYRLNEAFNFIAQLEDSTIKFRLPLEIFEESNICAIAEMPDSLLTKYDWLINCTTPDSSANRILTADFKLYQLDDDAEKEMICRIFHAECIGAAVDYIILNKIDGEWKNAGRFSALDHYAMVCDDSIYSLPPYFGLIDHSWGTAYSADNLSLYKLSGDTILSCLILNELNAFHGFPSIFSDYPDSKYIRNSEIQLTGDQLSVVFKVNVSLICPDDDSEYWLIKNEKVQVNFHYDSVTNQFIPNSNSNETNWLDNYNNEIYTFNLDDYSHFRLRQIAKTGNTRQKYLLENYQK